MKSIKIKDKGLFINKMILAFPNLFYNTDIGQNKECVIMDKKSFLDLNSRWLCQVLFNDKDKNYYVNDIKLDFFDNIDDLIKFLNVISGEKA